MKSLEKKRMNLEDVAVTAENLAQQQDVLVEWDGSIA